MSKTTEHVDHDERALFAALENLTPMKRTRPLKFTRETVEKFYAKVATGVSWAQINALLVERNMGYETSQKLASAVNDMARVYGIENPRSTKRKPSVDGTPVAGTPSPTGAAMTDAEAVTHAPGRNGATGEPERELVHAS